MRRVSGIMFAVAAVILIPSMGFGQADASHSVAGGGIMAAGWMGQADGGASVNEAKFATEGKGFHVTTGPATTYWNPTNKAAGTYTVMATFTEPKFQNLNTHPHPYGIMIGGNDLSTPQATYFYCAVNGNGSFIARGMGPAPFQMNGRAGAPSDAVHKAAAVGASVTNTISISVSGDNVNCSMNGTVVASYPKADLVVAGKLKSTDGIWGLRFAHNTEVVVSDVMLMK